MFDEEISNALNWLQSKQSSMGGWSGPFPDREWSGAWTTAGVLLAYFINRKTPNKSINAGVKWLIEEQNADGGWPRIQSDISSVESTSWAVMSLSMSSPSSMSLSSASLRNGVLWLLDIQLESGGWDFHSIPDSVSRVIPTSFVVLALVDLVDISDDLDDRINQSLQKALKWLVSEQNVDGSWANTNGGTPDDNASALALLALTRINCVFPSAVKQEVFSNAQKWLVSNQLEDGGWALSNDRILYKTYSSTREDEKPIVYLRDLYWDWFPTPWVLSALVESGVDIASNPIQRGLRYLLDLQMPEGGWKHTAGSVAMFWSTYQVLYCLNILVNFLDARSVYKIFEARLQARDEQIRLLKSDPHLSDEHPALIHEMKISPPVIWGDNRGIIASKRLVKIILSISLILFALILALLYFPSNVFKVTNLIKEEYLKPVVSSLTFLEGVFVLAALRKITNISRENLIVAFFSFLVGLTLYFLS